MFKNTRGWRNNREQAAERERAEADQEWLRSQKLGSAFAFLVLIGFIGFWLSVDSWVPTLLSIRF